MAIPLEEIFGVAMLVPERREDVLALLRSTALPLDDLKRLYARWLRAVGITPTSEDLQMLTRLGPGRGALP